MMKTNKNMTKKAVSPVIATVLLIAIVVVLGLIVFLWFQGIAKESIQKFERNIELVCEDIKFNGEYSGGQLHVSNSGNVPIFGLKIKKIKSGNYITEDLQDFILNPGETKSSAFSAGNYTKFELIPVLMGQSKTGQTTYVCDRNSQEVIVNE